MHQTFRTILSSFFVFLLGGASVATVVFFIESFSFKKPVITETTPVVLTANVVTAPAIEKRPPSFIQPFTQLKEDFKKEGVKYLEVNIANKEITLYENKDVVFTVPVLATGDPQGWGGTPAGLYSVVYKNKNAFSQVAQAYMPNAIHFYGKYFMHGEPYYANNAKIVSDFSGGCIRIDDKNSSLVFNNTEPETPVLVIDKNYDTFTYPTAVTKPLPKLSAESFLVADLISGEIIAEQNSTTVHPIASLTKLMTAIVVAEHTDLRKSSYATETMLKAYGNTNGLVANTSYRLVELLYPLLIESSNDAAEVLTGFLGRKRTLALMNKKAKHLLMNNTSYSDPSGYDNGNKSNAQDLFLLSRYILNNRNPLWKITKGDNVTTFGSIRFPATKLFNKNEFHTEPEFIGGKTGYTLAAKHTGMFLFNLDINGTNRPVSIIVLQTESSKNDVSLLKDWIKDNYSL